MRKLQGEERILSSILCLQVPVVNVTSFRGVLPFSRMKGKNIWRNINRVSRGSYLCMGCLKVNISHPPGRSHLPSIQSYRRDNKTQPWNLMFVPATPRKDPSVCLNQLWTTKL